MTGTPSEAAAREAITRGGRLIYGLTSIVRHGPGTDPRLKITAGGLIDLPPTAAAFELTVRAMEQHILDRRHQTARAAYTMFSLGIGFVVLWVYGATRTQLTSARLLAVIEFIPFGLVFFLLSFRSALMNWQLRTGRLGSAWAYLQAPEPFLPN